MGFDGLFVVDRMGRSGGLALLWDANTNVSLLSYARNFIDVHVEVAGLGDWRLTGFYGFPESSRRRQSWDLLRFLSSSSTAPWVCLGDFNDLLAASEKKSRLEHPQWKLQGFKKAISDSGLLDVGMEGYQFTWERSRGSVDWVEERLDIVLASAEWLHRFARVKVMSLEASCSDHLPIFMDPNPINTTSRHKRFRFENLWLRERDCVEVITNSCNSSSGCSIQQKISRCGADLFQWGGHLARDFRKRISDCKCLMARLRGRRDQGSVEAFVEARNRYNALLHSHEVFWKQRAKSLWLKEGDRNSRFFHATASTRKRRNSIERLRNRQGI
ncbi:uncharacterized protein LOC127903030 [Citrus sinensis]|uniref:uncharacterized protein LOC127903030 n=1 Tax=Citrus sinensis TaxID=2711 RepID=UPI0022784256|nr:uncharacterized protein LOC127903030 [Citrus sinensis]